MSRPHNHHRATAVAGHTWPQNTTSTVSDGGLTPSDGVRWRPDTVGRCHGWGLTPSDGIKTPPRHRPTVSSPPSDTVRRPPMAAQHRSGGVTHIVSTPSGMRQTLSAHLSLTRTPTQPYRFKHTALSVPQFEFRYLTLICTSARRITAGSPPPTSHIFRFTTPRFQTFCIVGSYVIAAHCP